MYLSAIIAANLIITTFGPSASIITALVFIGLDITARDALHEAWHHDQLWLKMALLIGTGSLLSYLVEAGSARVAVASFTAFAGAGIADTMIYTLLSKRSWMVKVNGSNLVSAAIDSLLFSPLAFGVILPVVIIGQFAAKVIGGAAWSLMLAHRVMVTE